MKRSMLFLTVLLFLHPLQNVYASTIKMFPTPAPPLRIAPGWGGMWFTEENKHIGFITDNGAIKEYNIGINLLAIAVYKSTVWFGSQSNIVGYFEDGKIKLFSLKSGNGIVSLIPDFQERVWFLEDVGNYGYITKAGVIKEYLPPGKKRLTCLALGKDGALWGSTTERIYNLTKSITYILPRETYPGALAEGSDGNIWFIENGHVGKMTLKGKVTLFRSMVLDDSGGGIVSLGDSLYYNGTNGLGRITIHGVETLVPGIGIDRDANPTIAVGDGKIWFASYAGGLIERISP